MPAGALRALKISANDASGYREQDVDARRSHAPELAALKEKLLAVERENDELKQRLKDTEALLGQYVVAASRQSHTGSDVLPPNPNLSQSTRKRARSPSLEILDEPGPSRKQVKESKASSVATPPVTSTESESEVRTSTPRKTQIAKSAFLPLSNIKLSPSEKKFNKTEPSSAQKPRLTSLQAPSPIEEHQTGSEEDDVDPNDFQHTSSSVSSTQLPSAGPAPRSEISSKAEDPDQKGGKAKNGFNLPLETVKRYIGPSKALVITPPPLDLEVPRAFLRLAYGGSDQHFVQYIAKEMNPSGPQQRRIVFPMLDMNPVMPSAPGEAGLVFASRHEILSNSPWSLFCKRSKAAPAVWLYLGDYENTLCGTMTAGEFKAQTTTTKLEWAKLILKMKAFDVYVAMRARIALRKFGLLPTKNKEEEEKLVKTEMQAIKNGKGRKLKETEVVTAFSNGDEGIDIIRMTCVKYDHVFANDIRERYKGYDNLILASKKKKEGVKEKRKAGNSKPRNSRDSTRHTTRKVQTRKASSSAGESDVPDDGGAADSDLDYVVPSGSGRDASSSNSLPPSMARPQRAAARSLSFAYLNDGDDEELGSAFDGDLTDIEDD